MFRCGFSGGGGGGGGGATTVVGSRPDAAFYKQLLCKFQRTDELNANNGKFNADHVVTQVQEHDKSL